MTYSRIQNQMGNWRKYNSDAKPLIQVSSLSEDIKWNSIPISVKAYEMTKGCKTTQYAAAYYKHKRLTIYGANARCCIFCSRPSFTNKIHTQRYYLHVDIVPAQHTQLRHIWREQWVLHWPLQWILMSSSASQGLWLGSQLSPYIHSLSLPNHINLRTNNIYTQG